MYRIALYKISESKIDTKPKEWIMNITEKIEMNNE